MGRSSTKQRTTKANANAIMVLGRRGMNSSWLVVAFVVLLALVVAVSAAHTDDINVRKLQQFTAPPPTEQRQLLTKKKRAMPRRPRPRPRPPHCHHPPPLPPPRPTPPPPPPPEKKMLILRRMPRLLMPTPTTRARRIASTATTRLASWTPRQPRRTSPPSSPR